MVVLKALLKRWNKKCNWRMYLLLEQGWSFCWRGAQILTVAAVILVRFCKFVKFFSDLILCFVELSILMGSGEAVGFSVKEQGIR